MKFGIDIGHNCRPDSGAVGIKSEDALTTDVGNRVIAKLRALGHEVVECKPNEASSVGNSLAQRVRTANAHRVDMFASIHFNAFNGKAHGAEVFIASQSGRQFGEPVLNELVKLGFANRGLKSGSPFYVLKYTRMPAILIECCFIDSPRDMTIFDPEATAIAIVRGLTGKTSTEPFIPDEELNTDTSSTRLERALKQLKFEQLRDFQKIMGLEPSGVADASTWNAINLIFSKPMIRLHHAGGAPVRYIQYRLDADVDGVYGVLSEASVKKFQREHQLLVDGIVGANTWKALIGDSV